MKSSLKNCLDKYLAKESEGRVQLVSQLIKNESNKDNSLQTLNFRGNSESQKINDIVHGLFNSFGISSEKLLKESDSRMSNETEKKLIELGLDFIQAVDSGNFEEVQKFLDFDFPVNFQHPDFLETAMHRAASRQGETSIKMVNILNATGKVDYLLTDSFGKYAVDNALISGEEDAVEILSQPTRQAAESAGIDYDDRQSEILINWHGRFPS